MRGQEPFRKHKKLSWKQCSIQYTDLHVRTLPSLKKHFTPADHSDLERQQPSWSSILTEGPHSPEAAIMAQSHILWGMHRQQKAKQKKKTSLCLQKKAGLRLKLHLCRYGSEIMHNSLNYSPKGQPHRLNVETISFQPTFKSMWSDYKKAVYDRKDLNLECFLHRRFTRWWHACFVSARNSSSSTDGTFSSTTASQTWRWCNLETSSHLFKLQCSLFRTDA